MLKNIYPLVIVDNLESIKQFYTQALGFTLVFESEWYIQLDKDNRQLAFMLANTQNQPPILHTRFSGKGLVITLEYSDVDSIYASFTQPDKIVQELRDEPWGQRHFLVQDPVGIIIDLVNYTTAGDYTASI
jgi:uncharacterized glyoxalase superfamily protein PhnB